MAQSTPIDDENEGFENATIFIPESQDLVRFHDHELVTAKLADGFGYVGLRSLAEAFGIDRRSFARRLDRNDYYSEYVCKIQLMTKGGPQPQLCMDARAVPMFLLGTSLMAIKDPEARQTFTLLLDECREVLSEHFGISERGESHFMTETVARLIIEREADDMNPDTPPPAKRYVDQEVAKLRQEHEKKVEEIRKAFSELRGQVRALSDIDRLTPEQAAQVNATVESLGYIRQRLGEPNPYPGIYSNIFRFAGVGATERIPQIKFNEVMEYLENEIRIFTSPPYDTTSSELTPSKKAKKAKK